MVDGSPLDERIGESFIPAVASGSPGYLKNFQLDVVSEMRGLLFAYAEQSFREFYARCECTVAEIEAHTDGLIIDH